MALRGYHVSKCRRLGYSPIDRKSNRMPMKDKPPIVVSVMFATVLSTGVVFVAMLIAGGIASFSEDLSSFLIFCYIILLLSISFRLIKSGLNK